MNKIGFSLTVVFVISSVILLAELFYVLWRRRLFHRQAAGSATESSPTGAASYSKDLLYFYFCLNSPRISRVEPESAPPIPDSGRSPPGDEAEEEVIDVFKLQNMCYGPPRFLFTINEEERENDAESEGRTESGGSRSVRLKEVLMAAAAADGDDQCESTVKSERESMGKECAIELDDEILKAAAEDQDQSAAAVVGESVRDECAVELEGEMEDDTTPFTTPCGSPLYFFTPSASPVHQLRITVPPLPAADYCVEV